MKEYRRLSLREERIGKAIVDSAFKVHKTFGPGLLESVYEACFCYELKAHGLKFERQKQITIQYDTLEFEAALRIDVLVEKLVVCELKAVELLIPVHRAQILSYLRLSGKRLGFLINFNVPLIRDGISRLIL